MRPLPLLGAFLLTLPAAARDKGDGPSREPKKEPTPIERACRDKKIRITLAGEPPEAAGPDGAALPKPTLKDEANQAASELGGRLQFWTDDQGDRTMRWHRGKKTPAQCVDSLNALAARFPGRLMITDPRYGRSAEKIKVGSDVASAEVAKVEKALPKAEIRSGPGFFEKFFDGGTTPGAVSPGQGPGGFIENSGDPSSAQAFWRAEQARTAGTAPSWRDGTAFPSTFNRDSAAPPLPGSVSSSEPWWKSSGRSAARTFDQGVTAVTSGVGYVADNVSYYGGKAADWVNENLIKAPLASFTRISSTFGSRFHPLKKKWTHHSGVDYAANQGTPVQSAGEGTVVKAGWNGGYGKAITIRHASGTETLYGHLSAIGVVEGQKVTAGRVIGNVGSTGQSTGPHLHYEVRLPNGRPVDPLKVASL